MIGPPAKATSMRTDSGSVLMPGKPPLSGRRARRRDGRTRPAVRTAPLVGSRRSTRRRRTRARRALLRHRRPRRRHGAGPGPRLARNRCTAVSVPAGASNSTRLGPRSSDAASTPWSETAARCSSTPPKSRSYVAIAASRSLTATPRWWMPRVVTRPMLSTRYSTARSSARIVPTVSAELDSCPMPTIIATNSWRSIVSFSSSVSASRSSGARCLRRSRVASS